MATLVRPLCMAAVAPARSQAWKSACWVAVVGMFPPNPRRLFFSSRRRHTIYWRDWSSDVCSSDLLLLMREEKAKALGYAPLGFVKSWAYAAVDPGWQLLMAPVFAVPRALERAGLGLADRTSVVLGHECRSRWSRYH